MPGPRILNFHSMVPRRDGRLLDYAHAQIALDVNLDHNDLQCWKYGPPILTCDNADQKIYDVESDCGLKCIDPDMKLARGIPTQREKLIYYTFGGEAFFAKGSNFCIDAHLPLGVPCPASQPIGTGGAEDKTCSTACSYVYTYVNRYGHESAPSAPSAPILCYENAGGVGGLSIPPPGYGIDRVRIYRAMSQHVTGDEVPAISGGDFFLMGELFAVVTDVDVTGFDAVAESVVSHRWFPPPPLIDNLVFLPHGVLAVSAGSLIHFSEPHQYHAFPRDRDLAIRDTIVAMREYEGDLYVLTDGHPYYIRVTMRNDIGPVYEVFRHSEPIPCVSEESVSVGSSGILWASVDGLFHMKETKVQNISEPFFAEDDWRQMSNIRGKSHQGVYYFTSDTPWVDSITGTEIYSWRYAYGDVIYEKVTNAHLTGLSIRPDLWYTNRWDKLYYKIGTEVFEWNPPDGTYTTPYTWVSRVNIQPGLVNYAGIRVVHDRDGHLDFEVRKYKCGRSRTTYRRPVLICDPFRLPKCYLGIDHYLKLQGCSRTREIHMSTSYNDLMEHGGNLESERT